MSVLDQLLQLKSTYNEIQEQIAVFKRDRAEMEVIRIQRDEEINQLRSELKKIRTKIDDNTRLYEAYLDRIKKDDAKIEKYSVVIQDLKKEIAKKSTAKKR